MTVKGFSKSSVGAARIAFLLALVLIPIKAEAGSHSATSGPIAVDTLNQQNIYGLEIVGSDEIDANSFHDYHCFANGIDVTDRVKWGLTKKVFGPDEPVFQGNTLYSGNMIGQTVEATISATYQGDIQTLTATKDIVVTPIFSVLLGIIDTEYIIIENARFWTITALASSFGPNGPSVHTEWDVNEDGVFDRTGEVVSFSVSIGTTLIRCRATDSAGRIATREVLLTFDEWPSHMSEVQPPKVSDVLTSSFWNKDGDPFEFDPSRKTNGLVVIAHGLCNSVASSSWLTEMATEVEKRILREGEPLPNICIYDWSSMADPDQLQGSGTSCAGGILSPRELRSVKQYGLANGSVLADWLRQKIQSGDVDPARPIHLIGHSAGGFVAHRCAHDLLGTKRIDQITLLDTPFPVDAEIDRYLEAGGRAQLFKSKWGGRVKEQTGAWQEDVSPPENHSWAREWYTYTIRNRRFANGFYYSPFLTDKFHPTPVGASLRKPASFSLISTSTNLLTDFRLIGSTTESNGIFNVFEDSNSGFEKTMQMPFGAQSLLFRFRFQAPGDGDFLVVSWGTNDVLYIGLDLPLTRDNALNAIADLTTIAGSSNTLSFTLVSRGDGNAALSVESIAIVEVDDPDEDGLTTDNEILLGTNPLERDTDGDGLSDWEEVYVTFTNPLEYDTDGDGVSDGDEVHSGTDPNDPSSHLAIAGIGVESNGSVTITWSSVTGMLYKIKRSPDLSRESFETLPLSIPGASPITFHTDELPSVFSSTGRFYWIEASGQ